MAAAPPAVELREVARTFGAGAATVRAVDRISLSVEPGEFFAMLGPSGSGKTTCLRLIAGFDLPDEGQLLLDGHDVSAVPPYERNVNTVFQDYALFPHMTVLENVAYGPRMRKVNATERSARAREMLDLVKLRGFEDRRPAQLSGGQKQRVALARALINHPKVLLLDEPLGALDLKLREEMQIELRNLQRRLGITFIYVTHDQGEALSMSDRVAVFNAGRIEQMASPRELYTRPRTAFVARFVGGANVAEGAVAQRLAGTAQSFAVRTESVQLIVPGREVPAGSVSASGTVLDVQYHGATSRWQVKLDEGQVFSATCNASEPPVVAPMPGEQVTLAWSRESMVMLEAGAMTVATDTLALSPRGPFRAVTTFFYRRSNFYLLLLLVPPLLWLGTVYLGTLFALLTQSIYSIDEFTAQIVRIPTLATYKQLVTQPANLDIVIRTLAMAVCVTIAAAIIAFPIANYMVRYASPRTKAVFYVAVLVPMWTSYLVKVYAWRLILAKEGILSWLFQSVGAQGFLDAILRLPGIGGPSLASSYIGMFIVFVYMWLPYMILPIAASLERVPASLIQASADLGAHPGQTLRSVILPLVMPGLAAGSVFTFSLTLGDYIIPSIVGAPGYFIGMMVYQQQGTAGNIPLAAAFSLVPIVLIAIYLAIVKRLGAFDAM